MKVKIQAITDHDHKPVHSFIVMQTRYLQIGETMTLASCDEDVKIGENVRTSKVDSVSITGDLMWVKTQNSIYVLQFVDYWGKQ